MATRPCTAAIGLRICVPKVTVREAVLEPRGHGPSNTLGTLPWEDPVVAASGHPEKDQRNLVEMVYSGSIPADNLGLLLFTAVRQNLLNDLPGPGEGGFDMGII